MVPWSCSISVWTLGDALHHSEMFTELQLCQVFTSVEVIVAPKMRGSSSKCSRETLVYSNTILGYLRDNKVKNKMTSLINEITAL